MRRGYAKANGVLGLCGEGALCVPDFVPAVHHGGPAVFGYDPEEYPSGFCADPGVYIEARQKGT